MPARKTGRYELTAVGDERLLAFVPYPLPPSAPPLAMHGRLAELETAAAQKLENLEMLGGSLPRMDQFAYAFAQKEAVLSTQLAGTQATLLDLLSHQIKPDPTGNENVEEICNYLNALDFARTEDSDPDGLPLSMRFFNEVHRRMLAGARGVDKLPGEMRGSQNWVGSVHPSDADFLPPPPHYLAELFFEDFEDYIHQESALPPLVRAGLLHVQFETIHPYLDGNGRMGRLLLTLFFEHWQLLTRPLLYLSLYFKRHWQEYCHRLKAVRTDGDWEGWLRFFLAGVANIADEATNAACELHDLVDADHKRVLRHGALQPALQIFALLPGQPIVSVKWAVQKLSMTEATARRGIGALAQAGVLVERPGRHRVDSWEYQGYLDRLRAGTELGSPPIGSTRNGVSSPVA